MLGYIIPTLFWNYFSKKYMSHPKYADVINYTIWSSVSWVAEINYLLGNDSVYFNMTHFLILTINTTYVYELIFHRPDSGHSIHHIVTIILQTFGLQSGFLTPIYALRMVNTSHKGYISSIFSALRCINKKYTTIYYYSYLVCKIGGMIWYYWIFMQCYTQLKWEFITYINLGLYAIVHLIQLYFSRKIIRKLI